MDTTARPGPDLDELNQAVAGRWRVWRSVDEHGRHAAWCATNIDPNSDRAPTLHARTVMELTRQMEDPPRRIRTALSDLQAPR
ncbi:hypothetical protein [Streptomonospora salina]|uniref:Uncharacterized protein n=1 Tax=Streptomonospora salina TaxID=104205 RepID=A0A841EEA7_9ACTN|nr:hypothetical protein [Streptomonospora salina]MBB6001326.1 hypothetical protein [Streptomonospora salina]